MGIPRIRFVLEVFLRLADPPLDVAGKDAATEQQPALPHSVEQGRADRYQEGALLLHDFVDEGRRVRITECFADDADLVVAERRRVPEKKRNVTRRLRFSMNLPISRSAMAVLPKIRRQIRVITTCEDRVRQQTQPRSAPMVSAKSTGWGRPILSASHCVKPLNSIEVFMILE